jgi:hypothetical protein
VESVVNEMLAEGINKKQTSYLFPNRGNRMKGSKARALPWTRQGESPWNQLLVVNIALEPFHPIAPWSMPWKGDPSRHVE